LIDRLEVLDSSREVGLAPEIVEKEFSAGFWGRFSAMRLYRLIGFSRVARA
jgi:hypothetical protein